MVLLFFGEDTAWLSWLSVFDFNIFQSAGDVCVAPFSPLAKFSLGVVVPILCVLLLLVTYGIHYLIWRHKHGKIDDGVPFAKNKYMRTLCALFLFSYNTIAFTSISFFGCERFEQYGSRMIRVPAVDCDSASYDEAIPLYLVLLLAITIAGPIVLIVCLFYHMRKRRLRTAKFLEHYGILYENYREQV